MDKVALEISSVVLQINELEAMLRKPSSSWSEKEREYVHHGEAEHLTILRLERNLEHLRTEKQQLRAEKLKLFDNFVPRTGSMESTVVRYPIPSLVQVVTNEGVPADFKTHRSDLGPPYAGKTGLASLLCESLKKDEDRSVVYLSCQNMVSDENFATFFTRVVKYDFLKFIHDTGERILILDEAQCTYSEEYLWTSIIKSALNGFQIPGLKIVLFSSYGSFNPLRVSERKGTPIEIPPSNCFGIYESPAGPGLNLDISEFREMISTSRFKDYVDIIWLVCSNHIGIASSILRHLNDVFRAGIEISASQVQKALYDLEILQTLSHNRGMPTLQSLSQLVQANPDQDPKKMKEVLDLVSMGQFVNIQNEVRDPRSARAVELLDMFGFLFEAPDGTLRFASQFHLKVWLNSNRVDPVPFLPTLTFIDFITMAIERMHASRLSNFYMGNNQDLARERQIQMELYAAIVSLLPPATYVTPEWQTADKKGYVDLVVQFQSTMWFLELLVDGIGAKEHSKRFEVGGKYYSSLIPDSQYALLDFRQNVLARDFKDDFLYITFSSTFENASLKAPGSKLKNVKLLP